MQIRNTQTSYGVVAKGLHWLIFLLIAGLLTVGFIMTDLPNSPDKFWVYGLHKSIGITVLAIVILRLGWKLTNAAPRLPDAMKPVEKFLAQAMHWFLYAAIIAMPLSGWAMSSAAGFPVSVFGLFTLPDLVQPDKMLKADLQTVHEILAYVIIACVGLHALAALLHHFYHKDDVLKRMLPMILVFIASPALADPPVYTLIPKKSAVKFFAIQNSAPVQGSFSEFTMDVRFDPDHLDQSRIDAEVNTGSVSVANGDVQQNIVLPEWLSIKAFPKAAFKSKTITRTPGTDSYYAEGDLTLRGKTLPVVLNFDLKETGDTAVATGYMTLRRKDFGIGQGEWAKDDVIKNEVRVELRIVAEKR